MSPTSTSNFQIPYHGDIAAEWAKNNKDSVVPCPPGTPCTCFAASALNTGFGAEIILTSHPAYFRVPDFLIYLTNTLGYTNVTFNNLSDGVYYPDWSPNLPQPLYGQLMNEAGWNRFILDNLSVIQKGDIVVYTTFPTEQASHVAVIVDFQPNPNQGNETWPMIVDQAGPLPSDQLPRFIDQTENPDIMQVDIVFIDR